MKKANRIKYQIFVDSANGSAILEEDDLDEAIRKAKQWSYNLHGGNDTSDFEVMLNDFTGADKVYIACGYTDLRKGIDGLARMVQQQFELDPFTNTLFLFCGRRRDRIKGLYWERDGFILLYKRLEQGAYQWPRSE